MANIVPASAPRILERTLDIVRLRTNSKGECFGGDITDALRVAGIVLNVDALDIRLTWAVLLRTMESLEEPYPAEVLQDYKERMPLSKALEYLTEAMNWTRRLRDSDGTESGCAANTPFRERG